MYHQVPCYSLPCCRSEPSIDRHWFEFLKIFKAQNPIYSWNGCSMPSLLKIPSKALGYSWKRSWYGFCESLPLGLRIYADCPWRRSLNATFQSTGIRRHVDHFSRQCSWVFDLQDHCCPYFATSRSSTWELKQYYPNHFNYRRSKVSSYCCQD